MTIKLRNRTHKLAYWLKREVSTSAELQHKPNVRQTRKLLSQLIMYPSRSDRAIDLVDASLDTGFQSTSLQHSQTDPTIAIRRSRQ